MQLLISAGLIALIVLWGLIAPVSLGSTFDQALVIATKTLVGCICGWCLAWFCYHFLALSRW